jgi:hypothetical protein
LSFSFIHNNTQHNTNNNHNTHGELDNPQLPTSPSFGKPSLGDDFDPQSLPPFLCVEQVLKSLDRSWC